MKIISADTMIPISLLGGLVGGVIWLALMFGDVGTGKEERAELKQDVDFLKNKINDNQAKAWETQSAIDRRLSRIEGQLDLILQRTRLKRPLPN